MLLSKYIIMDTLRIDILNKDAIAILKGMEKAGLISLSEKKTKKSNFRNN